MVFRTLMSLMPDGSMASISLSSNTKSAKRPGSMRPAVVFPAAAKGSIGRVGFQRLTRGNALIAPEQDTAVTDAVYRRVHTAEGGHRKDGRIHMQREGHTQTDAGTGGVHARGALGAKENGGVPISPDFDVPGEQARDDPASLHALKLRVGNELRMDEHVAQIPCAGTAPRPFQKLG